LSLFPIHRRRGRDCRGPHPCQLHLQARRRCLALPTYNASESNSDGYCATSRADQCAGGIAGHGSSNRLHPGSGLRRHGRLEQHDLEFSSRVIGRGRIGRRLVDETSLHVGRAEQLAQVTPGCGAGLDARQDRKGGPFFWLGQHHLLRHRDHWNPGHLWFRHLGFRHRAFGRPGFGPGVGRRFLDGNWWR
jgi:hypothetical protein